MAAESAAVTSGVRASLEYAAVQGYTIRKQSEAAAAAAAVSHWRMTARSALHSQSATVTSARGEGRAGRGGELGSTRGTKRDRGTTIGGTDTKP